MLFGIALPGQTQAPKSDAVTISLSSGTSGPSVSGAHGEVIVKGATLRDLIRVAYQIREFQISGEPAWSDSARYDITAKGEFRQLAPTFPEALGLRLQAVLQDKFKLKVHHESRQLAVYALTVASGGPELHPSKVANCAKFAWSREEFPPGQWPPDCVEAEAGPNLQLNHTLKAVGMRISAAADDPGALTTLLARELHRTVLDRTGITGLFDIYLEWNREATAKRLAAKPGDASRAFAPLDEEESPSLFSAVERQLGLKLESVKAPVEVIVIDQVENPLNSSLFSIPSPAAPRTRTRYRAART